MEIQKGILGFHVTSKHNRNLIHPSSQPFSICMPATSGSSVLCAAHGMGKTDEPLPTKSLQRRDKAQKVIKSDGLLAEKEGMHVRGAFKLILQNLFPGGHVGGRIGHGNT